VGEAEKQESDTFFMNIDEKGRPTIPKDIREEMGLEEGGTLCGKIVDGKLLMMVPDDPFDKLTLNAMNEVQAGKGRVLKEPGTPE
jgi:AbrB family looped-hinge helix DNA binding protein